MIPLALVEYKAGLKTEFSPEQAQALIISNGSIHIDR